MKYEWVCADVKWSAGLFGRFTGIAFDQAGRRGNNNCNAHGKQYGGHPDIALVFGVFPGDRNAGQCKKNHHQQKQHHNDIGAGGLVPGNDYFSKYRIFISRHWCFILCWHALFYRIAGHITTHYSILNLNDINVKNQGVYMYSKTSAKGKVSMFLNRFLFGLTIISFLWGCAGKSDKVLIKDTSQTVKPDTIIATRTDKSITFGQLMADLNRHQIIYVGENHTNPAHHVIQLKIIEAVFKNTPSMRVGLEMFDRSYQEVLDLWSAGALDEETFLRKVQWYANWQFDFGLYRDILEFIKKNRIKIVALNIPSYIPGRIRVGGIDNLSDTDKQYLPKEIDTSNADYRNYVEQAFNQHHFRDNVKFDDFYMAQCVWDEIMAESIAANLGENKIVVLAGNGHIRYKYGIPDRAFRRTEASFRTVYPVSAGKEIELGIADYIWVTP